MVSGSNSTLGAKNSLPNSTGSEHTSPGIGVSNLIRRTAFTATTTTATTAGEFLPNSTGSIVRLYDARGVDVDKWHGNGVVANDEKQKNKSDGEQQNAN